MAAETPSYSFFACNLAEKIMHNIGRWWDLDIVTLHTYNEWLSWLSNVRLIKKKKDILEGICYVAWWFIWKFDHKRVPVWIGAAEERGYFR